MSPDLLEHVHPDVLLRRTALPDRENARFLWEEAARHLSPVDIPEYEEFAARECMNERELGYWLPAGAAREKLREQIERNRRALETANLGLSLGRFQFPEPRGGEHFAEDTALADFCRSLARTRDFKARLHASCGEFAQAARELASALRTAELALDGDSIILTYLQGIPCQWKALDCMRRLARLPLMPAAAIADMLTSLERDWQGAEALSQSMRCEFRYYFLEPLALLSACESLEALVDGLLKSFYSDAPMLCFDEESRGPHPDGRSAWRRQRLLDLLSGHPSPFLAESTVSESSRALAEIVRRADEPWRPGRKQSEENKLLPEDSWPTQLRIGFPYDMLGPGPEARRTVEELSESTPEFARYWRVPDEAALAAAREKLQQLDNPVGRLLADSAIGTLPSCVDMLFRNRALREATKAVLAVRLYQIQRGRLPDDMHSLVTAGVLAAVPADPFADAPLGYSRERAEIWSVGPKNDAAVWMGKMTWSVSPI
jgi:hypothetical protein